MDEETKKKDQIVKGAIDALIQENASELNAPSQDDESNRRKRKREKKEEVIFLLKVLTFVQLYVWAGKSVLFRLGLGLHSMKWIIIFFLKFVMLT